MVGWWDDGMKNRYKSLLLAKHNFKCFLDGYQLQISWHHKICLAETTELCKQEKFKLKVKNKFKFQMLLRFDICLSVIFINVIFQLLEVSALWEIAWTLWFSTAKKWGINASTISWLFLTSPTGQVFATKSIC